MIATEKCEPRLVGGSPQHGWALRIHNWKRTLSLAFRRLLSPLAFRVKHVEGLTAREVAALSPLEIRAIPNHEMPLLSAEGIKRWSGEQLGALTTGQLQMLVGDQIVAFCINQHLTANQFERLLVGLSDPQYVGKISLVLAALRDDPLEDRKIIVLADALLNECSRPGAEEILVVFSRAATDKQFEFLVEAMPFWFIQELADHELLNPNQEEFDRLDLRVEERQLSNSYRLMQVMRSIEALEVQQQRLINGESIDINPKKAPWAGCHPKLVDALRTRLLRGIEDEEDLKEADRALGLIRMDLMQKQIHLQTENCRVSGLIELWNQSYLDECEMQGELLDKVVRPQIELLGDIAGLLVHKRSDPDITDEETQVLRDTLQQGCDLAGVIRPEVRKAKRLLHQLESDEAFFEESESLFLDLIRHEVRIGRYATEFFHRLLRLTENDKAYHILHGDGFEQLIVDNPQLAQGVQFMRAIDDLTERVQELRMKLDRLVRQMSIDDVSAEMTQAVRSLGE